MVRGGRGYSSRGSSYRGSSRGGNPWSGGGYGGGGRSSGRDRYSSSFDSYDKGRFSDRYRDDYPKAYRMDNYSRDRHSPERKRPRNDGPSRHEYGGGRYEQYPSERRGYSSERNDRHMSSPYGSSRREEFRKPPSSSPRGGGRGRISSRGSRGIRRDRGGIGPPRRRLNDRSYIIRKRGMIRPSEYSRRGSKVIRMRSSLARRRRVVMSSEKESSEDEEEKEKVKSEKDEDEDVEMKEEGAGKEGEVKEEKEGEEGAEKPKEKKEKKVEVEEPKKKIIIKYICPQCNVKMPTYRLYDDHLQSNTHLFSMRKVAGKQRSILAQMRQAQRNSQNELEKSGEGITDHTVFCPLCKLNYKQERAVHMATSAHKNMKKFLMPTCKICKHTFKSPMIYEHHLCTVEHLKRKQKLETSGEGEEDNLDEFTTIDSIGEVDENADEPEKEEKVKTKVVSVGIEQIKKIEAHYCDLCRMFLPRGTDNEYPDILAGHCMKRFHMQRYIRFKENEDLKKKAEKLQRKENAEKEKKKDDGDVAEKMDVKKDEEEESKEDLEETKDLDTSKSADDDKLWDAVDKDLGELLEETDGREDDDDEERVNGERYDRFKVQKEKNGEAGVEEEAETSEKAEEGKKDDESKK